MVDTDIPDTLPKCIRNIFLLWKIAAKTSFLTDTEKLARKLLYKGCRETS